MLYGDKTPTRAARRDVFFLCQNECYVSLLNCESTHLRMKNMKFNILIK